MKNLLAALFIASAALTLGACADSDSDPNLATPEQTFEVPDGFEVVVLEPSDSLEGVGDRPSYSSAADTLRVHERADATAESRRDPFAEGVTEVRLPADATGNTGNSGDVIGGESVDEIATAEAVPTSDTTPSSVTPEDPCQCIGASCQRDWVEQNIGCNVCVAFSCEKNPAHACNPC